jgi:hypothetical protein
VASVKGRYGGRLKFARIQHAASFLGRLLKMLGFDKWVSGKHKLINAFRDQLFDSVGSFVQLNCRADRFPAELFLFALDMLNFSAIALLSCALDSRTNRRNAPFSDGSNRPRP